MSWLSEGRPAARALRIGAFAPVIWGAFAFGAVYPWAYVPLACACGLLGGVLLLVGRKGRPPVGALAAALLVTGLAITIQLAPLPRGLLTSISPSATPLLAQYEQAYGVLRPAASDAGEGQAQTRPWRALSIAPDRTVVGLSLFVSLGLFLLGATRLVSATGARGVARVLIGIGLVLACVGIIQAGLTQDIKHPLLYGFWKPQFESQPFGPFVNPNHFAGWMLMVLPLALAWFYDRLHQTIEEVAGQRDRRALLSSPQLAGIMTFGFASLVMGLSLVMTRSRSGIAALVAGSLVALWIVLRRQRSTTARLTVILSFLVVVGGAAAWAGLDAVLDKALATDQTSDSLSARRSAWRDTLRLIGDFPLTGSGFNTYGTAMSVYQTENRDVHFEEAHDDYLQIAAEGGLLVGLPVLVTIGIFVRDVRRRFREAPKEGSTYWLRVGAVIGLLSIAAQSLVEFSLQMPGNAALFAVVAAIALHRSPHLQFDRGARETASRLPPHTRPPQSQR